jgi:hypothetical protein
MKSDNVISKCRTHKDYIRYLNKSTLLFNCENNHEFEIKSDLFHNRIRSFLPLCTICNPLGDSRSIKEKELFEYIRSIYDGEVIQSYRDSLEIDIYLPELKIGFEFNGLYWHSEEYKEKDYHFNKTDFFNKLGIRIIHIWEDDWSLKRDIIKSQIKNWLGLTKEKIWARSCKVIVINKSKISTEFLNKNHIQGSSKSSLKIGLYFNNELVSLMTFDHFEGRSKMEESEWNLSRFCNKLDTTVVGGASKILSYFIKNFNANRIISYADNDWSDGRLYLNLGFNRLRISSPDYKYIINNERVHKSRFRKSRLNTELTESEYMKRSNIKKIWDCGKVKFEMILK